MSVKQISFYDIKDLFDDTWDVGFLTKDQLQEVSLMPIKYKIHIEGVDFTNDIHFTGLSNTIVLIKQGHTWDYTHYDEAVDILRNSGLKNWIQVYTNFKEAALRAGLGVRARNSLIYSYKFGFDCHITAFAFGDEIIDIPTDKRFNKKLWNRCTDCYDCVNACPVKAIRAKQEPYWLNSSDCDSFIGISNHHTIPSIKKFWHEHVYPELSKEFVDSLDNFETVKKYYPNGLPWDKNGYSFDGKVVRKNGKAVNVPFCRECTSQPRCSKWNGKYPYEEIYKQTFKE